MQRTKFKPKNLPDAVYAGSEEEFTQIPNSIIRTPILSAKAKSILFILLSNKEGWHSYITTIQSMMKEGRSTIETAIKELENTGFLLRIRYRNIETKKWVGSFWAYTNIQYTFKLDEHLSALYYQGFEPHIKKPHLEKPHLEKPHVENQVLIILNNKNIKNKNINTTDGNKKIQKSYFNKFWKIYPKKDGKGAALTKWNTICVKPKKDKPSWREIKTAIIQQKETPRWKGGFIPNPATWLNQSRWLDDPREMKLYNYTKPKTNNGTGNSSIDYGEPDKEE